MSKTNTAGLYFISLISTLLIFFLIGTVLFLSDKGIPDAETAFSVTHPQEQTLQIDFLGARLSLDTTPLEPARKVRQDFAPLLTPRSLLTAEAVGGYVRDWTAVLYEQIEDYFFQKEVHGEASEI